MSTTEPTWAEKRAKLARRIAALEGRARVEPDTVKREALREKHGATPCTWAASATSSSSPSATSVASSPRNGRA